MNGLNSNGGLKVNKNRSLPLGDMMTSGPRLWSRAISGSMTLLQPGIGLISMATGITECHANDLGLGCHLRPGGDLRVMLQLGPALPQGVMKTTRLRLQLRAVSGFVAVL